MWGANLVNCLDLDNWKNITGNHVVLNWIREGITLPLISDISPFHYNNRQFSKGEADFIDIEIKNLLITNCVERVDETPKYVSAINVVPKKETFRLITDLRTINKAIETPKCTYEGVDEVLKTIEPTDNLVSFDLSNGFLHIPVRRDNRQNFCFQWKSVFYNWVVLPFGCSISPYYFVKIIRTVVEYLRSRDIRIIAYVDDFLLCADTQNICEQRNKVLRMLKSLGWFVNFEKRELEPSNKIQFIGYIIETIPESETIIISIPQARISKRKKDISRVLKVGSATARMLAGKAGQCVSMTKAILSAYLLLRNLYKCLAQKRSWQDLLNIDPATRADLEWWRSTLKVWNARHISKMQRSSTINNRCEQIWARGGAEDRYREQYDKARRAGFWAQTNGYEKFKLQGNKSCADGYAGVLTAFRKQERTASQRQYFRNCVPEFSGRPFPRADRYSGTNL